MCTPFFAFSVDFPSGYYWDLCAWSSCRISYLNRLWLGNNIVFTCLQITNCYMSWILNESKPFLCTQTCQCSSRQAATLCSSICSNQSHSQGPCDQSHGNQMTIPICHLWLCPYWSNQLTWRHCQGCEIDCTNSTVRKASDCYKQCSVNEAPVTYSKRNPSASAPLWLLQCTTSWRQGNYLSSSLTWLQAPLPT